MAQRTSAQRTKHNQSRLCFLCRWNGRTCNRFFIAPQSALIGLGDFLYMVIVILPYYEPYHCTV